MKVDRRDGTAVDLGVRPGIYQHVFMAVPVPASTDAWVPKPARMFQANYLNVQHRPWDVLDAQHFIMLQPTHANPPVTELYLVENWFEELKRLLPIR